MSKTRDHVPRFNDNQLEKIVQFVEEHPNLNDGKSDNSFAKRDLWIKLTEILNEDSFGPKKTVHQWRKCWADKKMGLRYKLKDQKKFTALEKRILRLIGLEAVKNEMSESEEIKDWNPCTLLITNVSGNYEISPELNERIEKCLENADISSKKQNTENVENSFIDADSSSSSNNQSNHRMSLLERMAIAAEKQAAAVEKQAFAIEKQQAAIEILAAQSIKQTEILNNILTILKK